MSSNYKNQILNELCKPSQKSFNNIRQIIADAGVSDFEDMFRYLYDNVEKYAPLSVGEVVIYIFIHLLSWLYLNEPMNS